MPAATRSASRAMARARVRVRVRVSPNLQRLEAPVGVEDGHEGHVVVLLPALHRVERRGDGRVVAHVDEQRRGLVRVRVKVRARARARA